jgi:hypothetical protein
MTRNASFEKAAYSREKKARCSAGRKEGLILHQVKISLIHAAFLSNHFTFVFFLRLLRK